MFKISNLNFYFLFKPMAVFSLFWVVISLSILFFRGMNLGIDFTGGLVIEALTSKEIPISEIRTKLSKIDLSIVAQEYESTKNKKGIIIKTGKKARKIDDFNIVSNLKKLLLEIDPKINFLRIEAIGPSISSELLFNSIIALLLSMFAILLYIWLRFEWQFALGAIVAIVHDVIITLGFLSLTDFTINVAIVAAILAIIGYSINDTVVVYDRIRENVRRASIRNIDIKSLFDKSLRETFTRTLITSFTTILSLCVMIVLINNIREFSITIVLGILIGTFSSIFVATPFLLLFNLQKSFRKYKESDIENFS